MKTTYKNANAFVTKSFPTVWKQAVQAVAYTQATYREEECAIRARWLSLSDEATIQCYEELQNYRRSVEIPRARFTRIHKATLHPVIQWLIEDGFRPLDWQQLMCEWPMQSVKKPGEIAYTRDEAKLLADVQTITPISKYVARHWANIPSSITRDYVAAYTASTNTSFEILTTTEGIVTAVEMGPPSCMKSRCGASSLEERYAALYRHKNYGDKVEAWSIASPEERENMTEPEWEAHPYAVYDPSLGWGIAIRKDSRGRIVGRAVVNTNEHAWVRSFKQAVNSDGDYDEDGYSYTDEALEAWLCDKGYTKQGGWHGDQIKAIQHPDGAYLMPYVDGNADKAEHNPNAGTFTLGDDGGDAQCTCGLHEAKEVYGECEDCGATVYEGDDYIHVGRSEDTLVCDCCADNYRYVTGSSYRGREAQYHVNENDAVCVDGEYFDSENLPDYIHECDDGEYRHENDCTYVEERDAYFPCDEVVSALDEDGNEEPWVRDDAYHGDDGKWYQTEEAMKAANEAVNAETTEGE